MDIDLAITAGQQLIDYFDYFNLEMLEYLDIDRDALQNWYTEIYMPTHYSLRYPLPTKKLPTSRLISFSATSKPALAPTTNPNATKQWKQQQ
jgi:hypothetical protein